MPDERVLKALIDLKIALGELHASLTNVETAIRALMGVELDVKKEGAEREEPVEDGGT